MSDSHGHGLRPVRTRSRRLRAGTGRSRSLPEQSLKPNQAIESAYEIVYKQDILYCFEDNDLNLSYKEKKHLLSKKRPLEFLYQEWLTTDCTHMQMIRDCIKDSTEYDLELTQKQKQKNGKER